mgnify:CR=1 FL=1
MNENVISQILTIVLAVLFLVFVVLIVVFIIIEARNKMKTKQPEQKEKIKGKSKATAKTSINTSNYTKQSIMNFMDFDKVEDNMIIRKKGKRFLMVVECQGINYDLMSGIEKVAVEEGFQQFLNTLRHSIQIYIQTRTVNLNNSISKYKERVKEIEDNYQRLQRQYDQMKNSGVYPQEELDRALYDLTKQHNLLEYAKDIVSNTEKMSLNKNILNKKYYIIVQYMAEEAGGEKYDYEEIKEMAFSELYTKCQSLIRTLTACSVNGKILTSKELVELLYVAYNRDESEVFSIDDALKSGYEDLYSTAPDVYEKKIQVLDEAINEQAIQLANEAIEKAKSKPQVIAENTEKNLETLVQKMAELVLDQNRQYVGNTVVDQAIEEIKKMQKEGGTKEDEKVKEKSTRGRKKKTTK